MKKKNDVAEVKEVDKKKNSLAMLKSVSKVVTDSKKDSDGKVEVKATGELAEAINGFVDAKAAEKQAVSDMKEFRPTIEGAGGHRISSILLKDDSCKSLFFYTDEGKKVRYTMTDKFKKIAFKSEEDKRGWIANLEEVVGEGKANDFIEEKAIITINDEALDNEDIARRFKKFIEKCRDEFGIDLITFQEGVAVRKGSTKMAASLVKDSDKLEKVLGMLKPTVTLTTDSED